MEFLFKPKYYEGECLSSYIHRVAEANLVNPHAVWRLLVPDGFHHPNTSISSQLDIYPESIFNSDKFETMLQLSNGIIHKLTFTPVLDKLGVKEKNQSRVISGIIEKNRRFCPHCLKENSIYKLIWQVKEIQFCPIHSTLLVSECERCNKKIPILPNSLFGTCPHCDFELKNSNVINHRLTEADIRALQDWNYLLDINKPGIRTIRNLSLEQSIALKIIYLVEVNNTTNMSPTEASNIGSIKQIARESKSNQTFIHLQSILYWIRKLNTPINKFFALYVPDTFIERTLSKREPLANKYYCIAPWCTSYSKSGSLCRTGTYKKTTKGKSVSYYYLYCNECGTEYYIDKSKRQLIERGYFINLAWNKVKDLLNEQYSLRQLARTLDTTVDKVLRSIIFLAANSLIDKGLISIKLPELHDDKTIEKMRNGIKQGMPAKKMRKRLHLSYNDFLFYWLRSDLTVSRIERCLGRPKPEEQNNMNKEACAKAIDFLKNHNIKITIKTVSNYLDVCPETLRNWGVFDDIKQAKAAQIAREQKINRMLYIKNAEKIVEELLENEKEITSQAVYEKIGKHRTVLARSYPGITQEISKIINKGKQLSKTFCV